MLRLLARLGIVGLQLFAHHFELRDHPPRPLGSAEAAAADGRLIRHPCVAAVEPGSGGGGWRLAALSLSLSRSLALLLVAGGCQAAAVHAPMLQSAAAKSLGSLGSRNHRLTRNRGFIFKINRRLQKSPNWAQSYRKPTRGPCRRKALAFFTFFSPRPPNPNDGSSILEAPTRPHDTRLTMWPTATIVGNPTKGGHSIGHIPRGRKERPPTRRQKACQQSRSCRGVIAMDAKPVVQVLEDGSERDASGCQATADDFGEKAAQSLSQSNCVANPEAQTAVCIQHDTVWHGTKRLLAQLQTPPVVRRWFVLYGPESFTPPRGRYVVALWVWAAMVATMQLMWTAHRDPTRLSVHQSMGLPLFHSLVRDICRMDSVDTEPYLWQYRWQGFASRRYDSRISYKFK
eukprot:SAG31_NODE_3000_length_4800_cov_2.243352_3_plen_401_part_00